MKPNSTELAILKLLWHNQPQTARDIHNAIEAKFAWTYSSTRKTLERMADKGMLVVALQGNKKSFTTPLKKVATLALFAQDFARDVLELDGPLPVSMFADSRLIKQEELDELSDFLDSMASSTNGGDK